MADEKAGKKALMTAKRVAKDPMEGMPIIKGPPEHAGLFDMSLMEETPKVEQRDLLRYNAPRGDPERVRSLLSDKGTLDKVMGTVDAGLKMGGQYWYNAEPLRHKFIQAYGVERGNEAFRKYMELVAATSPRSRVPENIRNASYYFHRQMTGKPVKMGERQPAPYGHIAQKLHQRNAEAIGRGAGFDVLQNPKPASFVENLVGNQRPVTVDTHAFRLPAMLAQDPRFLKTVYQSVQGAPKQNIQQLVERGALPMSDVAPAMWQEKPMKTEYAPMERYYQGIGQHLGLTPAQTQSSAWIGGGPLTGLQSTPQPFMSVLADRIHKTAAATGMDPHDVLNQFVRGQMPLRARGGAISDAVSIAQRLGRADGGSTPDQPPPDIPQASDLDERNTYSAAARTAMNLKQPAGTLSQMLAALKNAGGIKAEEMEGSGIAGYRPQAPTEPDLGPSLFEPTQMRPKQKGTPTDPWVTKEDLASHFRSALPPVQAVDLTGHETKYKSYTTPGGTNYRERILHLPEKGAGEKVPLSAVLDHARQRIMTYYGLKGLPPVQTPQEQANLLKEFREGTVGNIEKGAFREALQAHGLDYYDATLRGADTDEPHFIKGGDRRNENLNFYHGHWEQPNVLGWYRLNEHTLPSETGKPIRAASVQELQSDWGQKAGKSGTFDPKAPWEVQAFNPETQRYDKTLSKHASLDEAEAETDRLRHHEGKDYSDYTVHHGRDDLGKVVAGPWVASGTNAWTDRVLKELLTDAAQKGYQRLYLTPGGVQARRWGAERKYDEAQLHTPDANSRLRGDNEHRLDLMRDGYREDSHYLTDPEKELPGIVGPELAKQLLAQEPTSMKPELPPLDPKTLEMETQRWRSSRPEEPGEVHGWNFRIPGAAESGAHPLQYGFFVSKGEDRPDWPQAPDEATARSHAIAHMSKLIEDENQTRRGLPKVRLLKGDFRLGGEGHKKYYDEILPRRLLEQAKVHDKEVRLNVGPFPTAEVKKDTYAPRGEPRWMVETEQGHYNGTHGSRRFNTQDEATAYAREQNQMWPYLEITPKMRASILKQGFKAFRRGGAAMPSSVVAKALKLTASNNLRHTVTSRATRARTP